MLENILSEALTAVIILAIGAVSAQLSKAIKRWREKHENDLLGDLAAIAVRYVAQSPKFAELDSAAKLSAAIARVGSSLHVKVDEGKIESAVEAAYLDLKTEL